MRVAVYTRVSTADQSTDLQRKELDAYVAARGWQSAAVFEDAGRTGTNANRPSLKKLIADCRERKFDVVVVWKLDRFFRSLKDLVNTLQEFQELGVTFISLKDHVDLGTSQGRLLMQLLGAFAEFEASLIKERVRAGLAAARAKGRVGGRPRTVDPAAVWSAYGEIKSVRQTAKRLGIAASSVQAAIAAYRKTSGEAGRKS
jgi:DNA invertase Pin-like site-specific DNA recombinase